MKCIIIALFRNEPGRTILPIFLAALLLALGGTAAVVYAQSGGGYDLSWATVDGGGGTPSTGGGYILMSTVGQPEPGPAMSGGGFTLTGGFWPARLDSGDPSGPGTIYLPIVMK